MTEAASSRERLMQLVADATSAATGGHRTVPERLLQHRDLLLAVRELLDRDQRIDAAVQLLLAAVKRFPRYSAAHHAPGQPAGWTWSIRNAQQFHAAIDRLQELCPPTAKDSPP